jgi:hypothetical protein
MSSMRRTAVQIGLLLVVLTGACSRFSGERVPPTFRLPVPTADEVVVVDGRGVGIEAFEVLRAQLTTQETEYSLWAVSAVLLVQNESRAHGAELGPSAALRVVRYALGELDSSQAVDALIAFVGPDSPAPSPNDLRRRIDALMTRAVVKRNPRLLAELRPGVR